MALILVFALARFAGRPPHPRAGHVPLVTMPLVTFAGRPPHPRAGQLTHVRLCVAGRPPHPRAGRAPRHLSVAWPVTQTLTWVVRPVFCMA